LSSRADAARTVVGADRAAVRRCLDVDTVIQSQSGTAGVF
jgi:hypothetical protein